MSKLLSPSHLGLKSFQMPLALYLCWSLLWSYCSTLQLSKLYLSDLIHLDDLTQDTSPRCLWTCFYFKDSVTLCSPSGKQLCLCLLILKEHAIHTNIFCSFEQKKMFNSLWNHWLPPDLQCLFLSFRTDYLLGLNESQIGLWILSRPQSVESTL